MVSDDPFCVDDHNPFGRGFVDCFYQQVLQFDIFHAYSGCPVNHANAGDYSVNDGVESACGFSARSAVQAGCTKSQASLKISTTSRSRNSKRMNGVPRFIATRVPV